MDSPKQSLTVVEAKEAHSGQAAPAHRPFSVTLLVIAVLIMTGLSLTRLILGILDWAFLSETLSVWLALYIIISGAVWTFTGLPLAWSLWRGYFWAPLFLRLAALAYTLYYWADRLLLGRSPVLQTSWPFAALINLILLAWIFWVLARPKVEAFFADLAE